MEKTRLVIIAFETLQYSTGLLSLNLPSSAMLDDILFLLNHDFTVLVTSNHSWLKFNLPFSSGVPCGNGGWSCEVG